MCSHCHTDFSKRIWDPAEPLAREIHDAYMFPHGRPGYSGATVEDVIAAQLRCPFCNPAPLGTATVADISG